MLLKRNGLGTLLGFLILLLGAAPAVADIPTWLPRYDLDMHLDINQHLVHVRQRVTWTNRHRRPTQELAFNVHSHYQVPDAEVGLMAKILEILRMNPSTALDFEGPPLQVTRITLGDSELPFHYYDALAWEKYQETSASGSNSDARAESNEPAPDDNATTLVVPLPKPVGPGETVTIDVDFTFRLPQKQGRWGQWKGVTFLTNWLPVVAVYDEHGWHPTPYIPWHQPFFNEAGIYSGRVTLPCDQVVACSTSILASKDLGDGNKQLDLTPRCTRDFAFLCSALYQEFFGQVGSVKVRCVALPGHEHYARELVRFVCEAIPVYDVWIGPYPYPDFTIAESYFAWLGNECGGLVMIEERVFGMPELAGGYPEYLVSHELCHQWWYNMIGTNGYCETWMDEAMATYFSHRLMDQKHGRNNDMLHFPRGLGWLPNIHRETYRYYGLYGTIGRGDAGPTVQAMPKFGHLVNLLSMCYDRGGKIVGMIEDRLGEAAFCQFIHVIYARYQFRILRVADFQHELEAFTGQSWEEFFHQWLYGAGMVDWSVEKVKLEPVREKMLRPGYVPSFLSALHGRASDCQRLYRVTVLLHQKADYNEPTVLGFCLDGGEGYQVRIPIEPQAGVVELDDPPARVETLPNNRVRVEIVLPCKPTQISVDPDQVLVDRDPANNHWKPLVRWRFTPFNWIVEETDITCDYDRLNVIIGPGLFFPAYGDPWYTRSTVAGLRAAAYRTQEYDVGTYLGYRTDNRDIVAGVDGLLDHWPWHHTQVGFNVERSLTTIGADDNRHADRGVIFGRYVINYGSSLYLPPMQYVEVFGTILDHNLPLPKETLPGADHFDHQTAAGIHYHVDYLTPYWDPEGGYRFDTTFASGLPILGDHEAFNRVDGQFAYMKCLPDWLGPLSETRLALRLYGAVGLPDKGDYFTMGGNELFRGFSPSQRQGSLIWIGTVEWHVPIVRGVTWDCCDHLVGVRNIYLAPFYDVGDAYVRGQALGPVAHALGAGLRIDLAFFSFVERATIRFDLAKTINSSAPLQFWFGLAYPF